MSNQCRINFEPVPNVTCAKLWAFFSQHALRLALVSVGLVTMGFTPDRLLPLFLFKKGLVEVDFNA